MFYNLQHICQQLLNEISLGNLSSPSFITITKVMDHKGPY